MDLFLGLFLLLFCWGCVGFERVEGLTALCGIRTGLSLCFREREAVFCFHKRYPPFFAIKLRKKDGHPLSAPLPFIAMKLR
jgi:hypothetical protein